MREFQQKKIVRTVLYSKVTIVVLALVCLILLRSIVELNQKREKVAEERDKIHEEQSSLEQKVANAEARLSFVQTDRGKENYIRTTYPVVKDGEGVIVVYTASTSPVAEVKKDIGMWNRSVEWIKGLFAGSGSDN